MAGRWYNVVLFAGICNVVSACDAFTPSSNRSSGLRKDTISAADIPFDLDSVGNTIRESQEIARVQADTLPNDTHPSPSVRNLTEADKRYIDLVIPEYPDVIVLHEGNEETLNFTRQICEYLRVKNASVTVRQIEHLSADKPRGERLHIADVGENWYEVYVLDEWK